MKALRESLEKLGPIQTRSSFLKWQCRVRQAAMRENFGRPNDGIIPLLRDKNGQKDLGYIITVINKLPRYSVTAELKHMLKKTLDPIQRRDNAVRFLSAGYYQSSYEFSDTFTATFSPESTGANKILDNRECWAIFEAFNHHFSLYCRVRKLEEQSSLYQATFCHNKLFNPRLLPGTIVLAFEPDWEDSCFSN